MENKFELIANALGELDEEQFMEELNALIKADPTEDTANEAVKACAKGMEIVGNYFEEEEYFVGDLIFAADILTNGFDLLAPYLATDGGDKIGKIVLGSAPGDLHDIGKNIFMKMAEAAGFEVFDLGVDVAPEKFVEKVKEVNADIVGISGLLTLSLDTMGDVINALKEAGIRDNVKVMIGGNPVTEAVMLRVGADAYSTNASTGVKQCKELVM